MKSQTSLNTPSSPSEFDDRQNLVSRKSDLELQQQLSSNGNRNKNLDISSITEG
jgi:drug/metabolite transporter (DMT)-like permease